MRTPLQTLPLISLVALAALQGAVMPARASSESTIFVNTTDDELVNDGDCSLREAIYAANTDSNLYGCVQGSGNDTIFLPQGVYTLTRDSVDEEDFAVSGDLDIREDLTLLGADRDSSVIDGNSIDRVFHIIGIDMVVKISHLTIQNGSAPITATNQFGGGGILNQNEVGTLILDEVSVLNNQSDGVGGGITNEYILELNDSIVSDNHGVAGGGIYNGGTLTIRGSTLYLNTALETGGGLDDSGNVTLENVTISGNTAERGGGIFSDGEVNILHSSILQNLATDTDYGGNIHSGNLFYFYNTLIANSQSGPNCSGSGLNSLGYNLEGQLAGQYTCSFNRNYTDPLVDPLLADNGGPTPTQALLLGSPAVDAGDERYCADKDQRGAFRPADGDGDEIAICDIGAFEYEGVFSMFVFSPLILR